jgi:5'-deoxynucleotidase YfbR-like HD superfamily hydrolase
VSKLDLQKIRAYQRGSRVLRFHTESPELRESVGRHTADVAFICTILTEKPSVELLKGALVHDTGEQYTGDVPYPFKADNIGIANLLKAREEDYLTELKIWQPLTAKEEQILKAADMLDLVIKMHRIGTREAMQVMNTGIYALQLLVLPKPARYIVEKIVEELISGR